MTRSTLGGSRRRPRGWAWALAGAVAAGAASAGCSSPSRAVEEPPRWLFVLGSSRLAASADATSGASLTVQGPATVLTPKSASFTDPTGLRPGGLLTAVRGVDDLNAYDHVVVQGGHDDGLAPRESLRTAVIHLVEGIRNRTSPDVPVTLVGPVPANLPAPAELVSTNEIMKEIAESRDVPFVDPIARGWTTRQTQLVPNVREQLSLALRS